MVIEDTRSDAATREATLADDPGAARTSDDRFAALTRRQVDAAFRLAWAILGDASEAEDVAQEAFAAAWRKRDTLRDPASFDAWFQRILVNACRMRLRQRRRSPVRAIPATSATRYEETPLPGDLAGGDESAQIGLRHAVADALAVLDPDHRIVVVLRYWADLTVDQIADRLGVPPGTVKSRLHYALRALHPELEDVR
jgi:RNA polymerase sigma-70 factor (ECF subfamily)